MMHSDMGALKKLSAIELLHRKAQEKITVMTCYDSTFAKLLDGQVDCLLVGDSLGMVIQGHSNTLSVTMEQMLYHTKAVTRVAKQSHVIADMPFLSYQTSPKDALLNAGKLISEGGADSIKLEGGVRMAETVKLLVDTGIPVMGHIGLTPQSVQVFGGFKIQGKTEAQAKCIMEDALALEQAGCYALVLEGIPSGLAKQITQSVKIPTIGIGAGIDCDGQVLVLQDALGLNPDFSPRFVKRFANLASQVKEAVSSYAKEVRSGDFPTKEHSF